LRALPAVNRTPREVVVDSTGQRLAIPVRQASCKENPRMIRNSILALAGTALLGAAALFPSPASAGGNVAWSVSVGGPGFAVTAGEPGYFGAPYRPYYRPHFRPSHRPVVIAPPVAYRPWYGPAFGPVPYRVYAPQPVVYGPAPVVVGPRPYAVAPRPYGY
jgi:hypothetical protein